MKPNLNRSDEVVWGLTKNGIYSSKSGYQLLDTLEVLSSPTTLVTPPVEKQLWTAIWKTKTTPKLRHFLWRTLSGALAVKERLRSRGILLDTTCSSCNEAPRRHWSCSFSLQICSGGVGIVLGSYASVRVLVSLYFPEPASFDLV